jgi:uncharacterized protein YcbX
MKHPLIISQLYIYPIKSLGGFSLQRSKVLPKGLEYDRRWMLIDDRHEFLTQRTLPIMALFRTSFSHDGKNIDVFYKGDKIQIPLEMKGSTLKAKVWGDEVEVIPAEEETNKWFSKNIGFSCRLVAFPEENTRPVDPDYAFAPDNKTSLSDGYPVLIMGQSSLDDLNARLEDRVGVDRFRPNIVFEGGIPYEEDTLKRFMIGSVAMEGVKPCGRCVMTTIDQQTGAGGKEPLATLSTYRKVGNKVLFGQNVIPVSEGFISVGDEIFTV